MIDRNLIENFVRFVCFACWENFSISTRFQIVWGIILNNSIVNYLTVGFIEDIFYLKQNQS